MEERRAVEQRTEAAREDRVTDPKTTNLNVGADGSTQIQEESHIVDDPVGSTTIRRDETVEKR